MEKNNLFDAKNIAEQIKDEVAAEVRQNMEKGNRPPHLAAILVGDDGASKTYVASKEKDSKNVGFTSSVYRYPENMTEKELLDVVDFLNRDSEVDGFIIQLPLPKHINEQKVLQSIDPDKDVDGFHPINVGKMVLGLPTFLPATPYGIITLLERSGVETSGKHCVVIGRSNIVGKPVAKLLLDANATVTIAHSRTADLAAVVRGADVVIAAVGVPKLITGDMVKPGAVVIDVGINRLPDGTLCGDVDFDSVKEKASLVSPVPGGVGPMTIAMLMDNTIECFLRRF